MLFNEFNMDDFGRVQRKEGLQVGLQKGRLKEKFDIARNMLIENMPFDIIGKLTGLSFNEIESLQKA